jgi:ATP-dependent Clp protease ATP-binding subunit ClpA
MVEPNEELQLVFDKAIKDAKKLHHEYVTLEHLLFSMLCSENFNNLLKGYGCLVKNRFARNCNAKRRTIQTKEDTNR